MSLEASPSRPAARPAPARPTAADAALLGRQLAALEAWHAERERREALTAGPGLSREQRLHLSRAAEVTERVQSALVQRTGLQLLGSGVPRRSGAAGRAVLVSRNAWYRTKVADALEQHGVDVVASLDNGADGLGALIAEQPDLLLVEDALPMLTGPELLRYAGHLAPRTRCVAHVDGQDRVPVLLEAGAVAAYTRRVPPADVAAGMLALLGVDAA